MDGRQYGQPERSMFPAGRGRGGIKIERMIGLEKFTGANYDQIGPFNGIGRNAVKF